MDGEGYIRLYWKTKRSIVGSNVLALGLWSQILLSCAVKKQILHNGQVLEPGECIVSATELAKQAGVSKTTMANYLSSMEREGMICVLKRDRNGTHISVSNFKTYQPQFFGELPESGRNVTATLPKRNRNDPQTENPNKPKSPNSVGATPRTAFVPPSVEEVAEHVAAKGYSIDPETFVAHYAARNWYLSNNRKMADWKAACITWQKNDTKYGKRPATGKMTPAAAGAAYLERRKNSVGT